MAPVAVALAVGVVLVDDDLGVVAEHVAGGGHRATDDLLGCSIEADHLCRIDALRRGDLGVGMIDVVASTVGQHGVHEVGLDIGRIGGVEAEPAGIVAGVLVLEVPTGATLEGADVR